MGDEHQHHPQSYVHEEEDEVVASFLLDNSTANLSQSFSSAKISSVNVTSKAVK